MTVLKSLALTFLIALYLPKAAGSPYVLTDDRVRSLDVTPVLGRGYSIMTNQFLSTCMDSSSLTTPSYNYDCKYTRAMSSLDL